MYGQLVSEKFTENIFSDTFDDDSGNWKIMSNADNLFLIQDGKYFLQRKNPKSAYSIFPKWENKSTAFEISANIILGETSDTESAAGIIFMAQADGSGAFVLEINDRKQYRLKQLVGVNFKWLTGSNKSNGWVDYPILNGPDQNNLVQIRSSARNYDIYLNQNYTFSFSEVAYKSGNVGISVGPASKFSIDQFSVYSIAVNEPGPVIIKKDSIETPADSIAILRQELDILRKENSILRDSLKYYKQGKKDLRSKDNTFGPEIIEPQKHPE